MCYMSFVKSDPLPPYSFELLSLRYVIPLYDKHIKCSWTFPGYFVIPNVTLNGMGGKVPHSPSHILLLLRGLEVCKPHSLPSGSASAPQKGTESQEEEGTHQHQWRLCQRQVAKCDCRQLWLQLCGGSFSGTSRHGGSWSPPAAAVTAPPAAKPSLQAPLVGRWQHLFDLWVPPPSPSGSFTHTKPFLIFSSSPYTASTVSSALDLFLLKISLGVSFSWVNTDPGSYFDQS